MAGPTSAAQSAAKARLAARFGGSTRTGGKGAVRRKKKTVYKNSSNDQKKLTNALKKLQANSIPGVEEANIFLKDGNVLHFEQPKVQAAIGANTYVIKGRCESKPISDMLPSILSQLGTDTPNWEALAKNIRSQDGAADAAADDSDDDDIPELVENFEEASEKQ